MQNDTLSYFKHAFSIGPQVPVWIDVSVEGDGSDFEFFAEVGDRCVTICHGGLREYCGTAGGQVVEQDNGSSYCAIWINRPDQ